MVDLKVLESKGCTPEVLKAKFAPKTGEPTGKVKELIDLNSDRIDRGIRECLDNARLFWAIDRAYDTAHRQISYTLVRGLLDMDPSREEVKNAVQQWGLTTLLSEFMTPDGKVDTGAKKGDYYAKLDLPTFFNIFVPMVMSYVKIRWAKLFTDRDQYPTYKYEAARLNSISRLKAEIVTDRIQRMTTQMGYRNDERQSILQSLLYSHCINFPREPWYRETQDIHIKDKIQEVVMREGIRFIRPHPSRYNWDQSFPIHTLNTNTGCEWAFYWDLWRYREVNNPKVYWNTDKISFGRNSWGNTTAYRIYEALYPCVMKFPSFLSGSPSGQQGGSTGVGDHDRTDAAFRYTSAANGDNAVCVAPIFHRLIPSEWDLFDYDKPVWMRFVYANSGTVIHAVPWCYNPCIAYIYDWDENRALNSSLALELIPWQDHIGNYLTQQLLSVKQNLTKLVFANTDLLDDEQIKLIKNLGEKRYRTLNFIPFSKQKFGRQLQRVEDAIHGVNLPIIPTAEISGAIQTMITVLERLLGFSPQEMGSSASHEQSASEVSIIQANTGIRLNFTEGFIDDSRHARKEQLYDAFLAHGSDDVFAQVGELHGVTPQQMEELGWKVQTGPDSKFGIDVQKKDLLMDGFISIRDGDRRVPTEKIAAQMLQSFQGIFSNPAIIEKAGVQQVFDLFNKILVYTGVPDDFRIKITDQAQGAANANDPQALMQQMAQIAQKIVGDQMGQLGQAIKTKIQVPLEQENQQTRSQVDALKQQLEAVLNAIGDANKMQPAQMGPPQGQPMGVGM